MQKRETLDEILEPFRGLKKFFFHEETLPSDVQTILDAVSALDIGEYSLFELAFVEWFGRTPSREEIERPFFVYLYEGTVPPYVVRYARKVTDLYYRGEVDRESLGFKPEHVRNVRMGILIGILLLSLLLLIQQMVAYISALGILPDCYFPPCY